MTNTKHTRSGEANPAFPAWSTQHTLVLPIAQQDWPLPDTAVEIDGVAFLPKRELHITLVGKALGAELREVAAGTAGVDDAIRAAFGAQDWCWTRLHRWLRLRKRADATARESIIELVELPAMAKFHQRLGVLTGRVLPVPPPHVTLFTAAGGPAIGVADAAALQRLTVRAIDGSELSLANC
ncbi:MAG: hypothetical protein LH470_01105 [Lysobacter sp.]|nr:hypothetical protein [Lysobacter sp.]